MNKTTNVLSWIIAALVGLAFIFFGVMKFPEIAQLAFDEKGLPDWFRMVIASVEVLCGLLLFIPATARISAIILSFVCVGAAFTHLIYGEYTGLIMPIILLVLLVLFVRWRSHHKKLVAV